METALRLTLPVYRDRVLIVPCGMETRVPLRETLKDFVLIVPCGMETAFFIFNWLQANGVLIVPCGMETQELHVRVVLPYLY